MGWPKYILQIQHLIWKRLRALTKYIDCQSFSHNLKIPMLISINLKKMCFNLHNRSYVAKYRAEKIFKHACQQKQYLYGRKKSWNNIFKC